MKLLPPAHLCSIGWAASKLKKDVKQSGMFKSFIKVRCALRDLLCLLPHCTPSLRTPATFPPCNATTCSRTDLPTLLCAP